MADAVEPGPQATARAIRDALALAVPGQLAALAASWGGVPLDAKRAGAAPSFVVDDRARLEPDVWPAVKVLPGRMSSHVAEDRGADGAMRYRVTYRVALWTWARGSTWEATVNARGRLMLAVRYALLGAPIAGGRRVVPGSLVEDYYDVAGRTERTAGPGVTSVDVVGREGVSLAALGAADTIAVVTERLPTGS